MANSQEYNYKFTANTSGLESSMSKVKGSISGVSQKTQTLTQKLEAATAKTEAFRKKNQALIKTAKSVSVGLGAAAVGLGLFAKNLVKSFSIQERVENQLSKVVESTKMAAGLTVDEIKKMAREFQSFTAIGDEVFLAGQNMLLTFTKIGKDVFPQATEALANMTISMNNGMIPTAEQMKTQAIQLGKALNDPVLGVTALRRVGIQLLPEQEKMIKKFVELGDVASAQKIILSELETQFGGLARGQIDTFEGKMARLGNTFGDFKESVGGAIADVLLKFEPLIRKIVTGLDNMSPAMKKTLGVTLVATTAILGFTAAAAGVVAIWPSVKLALLGMKAGLSLLLGPVGLVIAAVGLLTTAISKNWFGLGDLTKKVWGGIVKVTSTAADKVRDFMALSWKDRLQIVKIGAKGLLKIWVALKKDMLGNIVVIVKKGLKLFDHFLKNLTNIDWGKVWDNFADSAVSRLNNIGKSIMDFGKNLGSKLFDAIQGKDVEPISLKIKPLDKKQLGPIGESIQDILGQETLFENTKKAISEVGNEIDQILKKGKANRTAEELSVVSEEETETMNALNESMTSITEQNKNFQEQIINGNEEIQDSEKKSQSEFKNTEKSVNSLVRGTTKGFDTMASKTATTVEVMKQKLSELKSTLGQIRSITAPAEGPDTRTDHQVFSSTGAPNPLAPDPFTPYDSRNTGGIKTVSSGFVRPVANGNNKLSVQTRKAGEPIQITFKNNNFKDETDSKKTAMLMERTMTKVLRDSRRKGITTS